MNTCHLVAIAVLVAGCNAGERSGQKAEDQASTPAATPLSPTAAALDQLLLTASDVNAAAGASGMTVAGTWTQMLDANAHIAEKECVFAYPTERSVYAVSGWTAVRRQILNEPVVHPTHEVTQTVVSFASSGDAARFFASSAQQWPACANRQYRHVSTDDPDVLWTAGPVADADGALSVTDTRTNGWACQRALTVRGNIAADIAGCAQGNPADAAVKIARQIAAKVAEPPS